VNCLEVRIADFQAPRICLGTDLDNDIVYILNVPVREGDIVKFKHAFDPNTVYETTIDDFMAKGLAWESFLIAVKNTVSDIMAIWLDRICRSDSGFWDMFEGVFWEKSYIDQDKDDS